MAARTARKVSVIVDPVAGNAPRTLGAHFGRPSCFILQLQPLSRRVERGSELALSCHRLRRERPCPSSTARSLQAANFRSPATRTFCASAG